MMRFPRDRPDYNPPLRNNTPEARWPTIPSAVSAPTGSSASWATAAWAPSTWPPAPTSSSQKRVALKVIRGADSAEVVRHFKRERQILASLEHPNIARLLDGGSTDDGLPYFVMEHIEGQPILEYCDSRSLSVTDRLKLFQSVCSAVQYAHRNLVVHRDIKPGNILVTADGSPRLLDFGIAKLLNPELSGEAPTATAMADDARRTPAPSRSGASAITTASDVYSLGVVLYELLTGHHPYRLIEPSAPRRPQGHLRAGAGEAQHGRGTARADHGRRSACRGARRRTRRPGDDGVRGCRAEPA